MSKRKSLDDRLYLRGRTWWVRGYDINNDMWRESTHQSERKAALAVAKTIELRRTVPPDRAAQAQETTLGQVLELLAAADKRANAAANTIQFHRNCGRHLLRLLGREYKVASHELSHSNKYMDKRLEEDAGRHTIQKEFRVLIQALRLARDHKLYLGDPAELMPRALRKQRNYYRPVTRWLQTVEQCQALVNHISPGGKLVKVDRKLHVMAYLYTGLRKEELMMICPEHVFLSERRIRIEPLGDKRLKTEGAERWVWLSWQALPVFVRKLKDKPQGKPIFEPWGKADRDLKAAYRRAKKTAAKAAQDAGAELGAEWAMDSISLNDLRRTFCSFMASAGVPMQHCAKLMGHKSLDMVMEVYGRLTPESLLSAVQALPALDLSAVQEVVQVQGGETGPDAQVER